MLKKSIVKYLYFRYNIVLKYYENKKNTIEELNEMKSPRLIKSHLSASLLPADMWKKKSKVIYVVRSVKDTVVSAYHFFSGIGFYSCSLEEYAEMFMSNTLIYHPFWDHTLEFWEMRNQPNIFFTSYERMSKDLRSIIKDLCIFLKKPIPDESILDKAEKHLSFKNMKSR